MPTKKYFLFIIILFTAFTSCDDDRYKYYYLKNEIIRDAGFPYGSIVYRSVANYKIEQILISSEVISFKENRKYCVAQQKYDSATLRRAMYSYISFGVSNWGSEIWFYNCNISNSVVLNARTEDRIYNIIDSMFTTPPFNSLSKYDTNYWVIVKKSNQLIGPLNRKGFIDYFDKHDLPSKLMIP